MKHEPVVWDTLRPDVNFLMQAGIGYQGAIAMLSEDIMVMVHNLFPPAALAAMLSSMMFWNRLDEALWSNYVPERYYLRGELLLTDVHSEGVHPDFWPDLIDSDVRDARDVDDGASSEHGDLQRDANYNPEEEVDAQDDDDVQGSSDVPPAAKRRRTSVSSHTGSVTTPSVSATNTPLRHNRTGSLRRQSPLARVDSDALTVGTRRLWRSPVLAYHFGDIMAS
ncbi:hypothetical protein PHMEG_00030599 [Phytophthora megakarya]|uniref:Uncharacterized protein n=1 Tax=Phytophthora megakarya TaxID=4795 RepID=A0A225UZL0_9STRA|nr:hypothetical protein PHMEG_00030599 [Phytophthora megakarya]